jgi:hypothetical protein
VRLRIETCLSKEPTARAQVQTERRKVRKHEREKKGEKCAGRDRGSYINGVISNHAHTPPPSIRRRDARMGSSGDIICICDRREAKKKHWPATTVMLAFMQPTPQNRFWGVCTCARACIKSEVSGALLYPAEGTSTLVIDQERSARDTARKFITTERDRERSRIVVAKRRWELLFHVCIIQ